MLILEGGDLVGKTTLAHAVMKNINADESLHPVIYSHFTRLPNRWNFSSDYLPYITNHTVMDRFHLSELVYASLCGRKINPSLEWYNILTAVNRSTKGIMVAVVASDDYIDYQIERKNESGRVEMYDDELIRRANALYGLLVGADPNFYIKHIDAVVERCCRDLDRYAEPIRKSIDLRIVKPFKGDSVNVNLINMHAYDITRLWKAKQLQ